MKPIRSPSDEDVLRALEGNKGKTQREIAQLLEIGESSLQRAIARLKALGKLPPRLPRVVSKEMKKPRRYVRIME